jgi:NADPH-dependent glutamate synthase beta subunit-like oxidoreductase/Fe-S-cluster-containing hydrogenase component 2
MSAPKKRMTNERDYVQDPNYVAPDPEKEKMIIDLIKMITDRVKDKLLGRITNQDPEYWALDEILTKEQVSFLLSFKKVRTNYSFEQLRDMNGLTDEKCKEILDYVCWAGFVETNRENPEHTIQYDVPIFVPGIAEFMLLQDELIEKFPNLATMFNYLTQAPLENVTQMVPLGGAGVGMHVIPVEKAIETSNESIPIEHISHWLEKYDGQLGVGVCTCRRQQRIRGEGDGSVEQQCCIGLGDLAEWMRNTGRGRDITKEEALEILKRSERHGFVHQTTNIDGEDKIVGLCNCAPGVCNALRTSQLYNTPNLSRSAYRAHVEKDKCVACGKCVEVCPVGAAKLGQKLCTKNGLIQYPKVELPDATKWGEDKWNTNYREDAKINCYDTGTAPCKTACPAHLAVQGYVKMASEGRYEDALKLIKQDNPFPYVCGAICNKRCEQACTRGTIDQPVSIDEIKKFIAAQELNQDKRYVPLCETDHGGMWGEDYKMAVVGAGPAGLSCAYYLRERGYDVTVFEKESRPGGMLMNGIPNFVLEKEILEAEIDVLKQMGVEFKCNTEIGKDITLQQLRDQGYKAFYIAIGLQGGRNAGVDGEDSEGVESAVSFLKRTNQDHTIKLHGDLVVVGGGNVAIDVARVAKRVTDGHITMLCLEGENEMPASDDEVTLAKSEGIEIKNGWGPKEIKQENGKVTSIVFKKCTQVKDSEGRFSPQYDEEDTIEIPCENIVEAIGQAADWGNLLDGENVTRRKNGWVEADPTTFQTSQEDVFVGGDIYHGAKFAIDAIAEGKLASESMHRYVHEGQSLTIGRDLRQFIELDKDDIVVEGYDNAERQIPGIRKVDDPFKDTRELLTEEQVKIEAKRCLGCGATTVDENKCIGCGLCTTRCEFDAIHLTRDLPDASRMIKMEDKLKLVGPYAAKRAMKILFHKK